jgi:low temperature requirement protein LtrA
LCDRPGLQSRHLRGNTLAGHLVDEARLSLRYGTKKGRPPGGPLPYDAITIATGLLGLFVGFGFWWSYFDIVGRRLPQTGGPAIVRWLLGHLPITLAIAAAGAGMTSLIGHAHDPNVPATTAWLLAGAVAVGLTALVPTALALEDAVRLPEVYRKIATTFVVGALAALAAGWLQPAPWLLALLLSAILGIVWLVAIGRFLRAHAWTEADIESSERAPSVPGG